MSDPSARDREAQFADLVAKMHSNGAQSYDQETDHIRTVDDLSETERNIVLENFRFGYEAAKRAQRQDKMWAYRRLLRRLLRYQAPKPVVAPAKIAPNRPLPRASQATGRFVEHQGGAGKDKPNPIKKKTTGRRLVAFGLILGGVAGLLGMTYGSRSPVAGWQMDSSLLEVAWTTVDRLSKFARKVELPITSEKVNELPVRDPLEQTRTGAPGLPKDGNKESAKSAVSAAESQTAGPGGTLQTVPFKPAGRVQIGRPDVDAEETRGVSRQSYKNSSPVYETSRRILLREEPRFGAASQIMLDTGARLTLLEVDGKWLKVKMDKTGAVGFVREEFVVPVYRVLDSVTDLKETRPAS